MTALLSRPMLPKRLSLPRMHGPVEVSRLDVPKPSESEMDRWGFPRTLLPNLPDLSRHYLSVAYEYLRIDKHNPPSAYGAGTTPELVVFGALLDFGFDFPLGSERSFGFQSNLLGGRHLPGGTVSDFVVWNGGSRVGVYVDSVFHTPSFVWAGREKVEYERVLSERVIARTDITVVMRINRIELGMPLENGPDELVEREFERLLSA